MLNTRAQPSETSLRTGVCLLAPGALVSLLTCALALLFAGAGHGATYYVDPQGDDRNDGRSQSASWRSLARASAGQIAHGDRVLLKGGASWTETLSPTVSGRRSAPITFASYGTGTATLKGGIFLADVRWLQFERLAIAGVSQGVLASASGGGSRNITLRDLNISNVDIAVNSANSRDQNWRILRSRIRRTQDSAIIVRGTGFRIEHNTISDAGLGAGIPYAKHGVYVKGSRNYVGRNTINRVSDAGITTRFPDAVIEWNRISGAETGVSYFQNAAKRGRSIVRHNTISNVRDGIFLSSSSAELFLVHGNKLTARRNGLDARRLPGLWVWNNTIDAPDRYQFDGRRGRRAPVGYVDRSNPRLAALRSIRLTTAAESKAPRVLARIKCRSVARQRCRISVSAHVGKKRIAGGTLTIRKGDTKRILMRIRPSAVHADASARRPTTVTVRWTARDEARNKTIDHATVRVRL